MNVLYKDVLLFEISDLQKKVIMDSKVLSSFEDFDSDMTNRINWAINKAKQVKDEDEYVKRHIFLVVNEVYNESFKRLKKVWEPKLVARGEETIPTDKDAFAQLVFSQPDYKNRATRDAETQGA